MEEALKSTLVRWNMRYSERQKLQHVYICIIIASTLIAGLLSLVNRGLGFTTLRITLLAAVVYSVNVVVWSVLHSGLLVNIKTRTPKR
jgi:predicted membrane channel-forming protein YqfA (hemolysin III family)